MAGILTPASTAETPTSGSAQAPSPSSTPAKPVSPIPQLGRQPLTAGDLLSTTPQQAAANAAPPIHSNDAINAALMQAFRPVIPDQINTLLGPAIGHLQSQTMPIAFYQPRPVAPASVRRSS